MSKQIIIVGGGISGLAVLHNLKKKYKDRDDIHIRLIEKNDSVGGTAHTEIKSNALFEHGPNGFLDSKEATLNLARDLGLRDQIIHSNLQAKKRFLSIKNKLYELPSSPLGLLTFKPLSFMDKLRIFGELFKPKGGSDEESVYEFGKRRFGEKFAQYFLDPMMSGVFGGKAESLNLKCSFPRIFEMEREYGSIIKGFLMKRKRKGSRQKGKAGSLVSFKEGMSQLSNKLYEKYKDNINTNEWVKSITKVGDGFSIDTDKIKYFADELYMCLPAYNAAKTVVELNAELSTYLSQINYAPIAVVGLIYKKDSFPQVPKGFGYLIPSSEEKQILGVLFSSNIFQDRSDSGEMLFRIMIGGSRSSDVMHKSQDELIAMAKAELEVVLRVKTDSEAEFFIAWEKAIPQYDADYLKLKFRIEDECEKMPNFHIVCNYLGGISLNDCVQNAQNSAEKSNFSK